MHEPTAYGEESACRPTRQIEDLYRYALASVSDVVFLTDADGRFTFISPNVGVIFGYSVAEVGQMGRIQGLLGESHVDTAELTMLGGIRNIVLDATTKSKRRRTLLMDAKCVYIEGATMLLYCCRDITELRSAEDQVRELLAALNHAARLGLAGRLMASISHEVKQSLAAIVIDATAARRAIGANDACAAEVPEILDDIVTGGRRAADVIDRLRSLSRKQPLSLRPVDLNLVVTATMSLLEGEARRRHVALCAELEASLPDVRADPVCMQQVLLNLGLNAIDAMDDVEPSARKLWLRTRRIDSDVEITVSDTGGGIHADVSCKLFEPFVTTKNRGLGLGLAIAGSIVDAHRGRIWAADNSELGAEFHIALPAVDSRFGTGSRQRASTRSEQHC